jgi:hypothetical protein
MDNSDKIILDLCGGTGAWSKPYKDNGYTVVLVDIKNGDDVRLFKIDYEIYGILAAPDCTHLASSGARWWKSKGEKALIEALSISDACVRMAMFYRPAFWALENPVGRLRGYYRDPQLIFDPCDYGDPYTKKTLLWGNFNPPKKNPVEPTQGSRMHRMSSSWKTQRSITPPGFAQAFYGANK